MARLQKLGSDRECVLEAEHLVGRAVQSALQLEESYISAQHALMRWNGTGWEITDRASRNGTRVNGKILDPGRACALSEGAIIAFGHADEQWVLVDASEPSVCVFDVVAGQYVTGQDGVIGIPDNQAPQCTIYRDADGAWKLELGDQSAEDIRNGMSFEAAGRRWRFICPELVRSTEAVDGSRPDAELALHFVVSADEEYVELFARAATGPLNLGSRSHNYLLLTLARARLGDRETNLPEGSCGWVYKQDLSEGLRVSPQHIDLEVFRLRKHFARLGVERAGSVIERRARTGQLRIGTSKLRVTRMQ